MLATYPENYSRVSLSAYLAPRKTPCQTLIAVWGIRPPKRAFCPPRNRCQEVLRGPGATILILDMCPMSCSCLFLVLADRSAGGRRRHRWHRTTETVRLLCRRGSSE